MSGNVVKKASIISNSRIVPNFVHTYFSSDGIPKLIVEGRGLWVGC